MVMKRTAARSLCIAVAMMTPLLAQDPNPDRLISPERGLTAGRAYELGSIESVNLSNGGLTLRLPIAQLPAGPAGTAGVNLVYNSKYWEDVTAVTSGGSSGIVTHMLQGAPTGGWRLKFGYELQGVFPENRTAITDVCSPGSSPLVQLKLVEPDGTEHRMYSANVPLMPTGCEAGTYRKDEVDNSVLQVWYTLDNSHLRLEVQPGSLWPNNDWTLYEPNGSRVEYRNTVNGATTTRFDKNGNTITWRRSSELDANNIARDVDTLEDQFGHSIRIWDFVDRWEVRQHGNSGELVTTINLGFLDFTNLTYYNSTGGGAQTYAYFSGSGQPDGVTSVQLPPRMTPGGATYTPTFQFQYNGPYKELSQMILPTGATVNYTWGLATGSYASAGRLGFHLVQLNPLVKKEVRDNASAPTVTEITHYTYNGGTINEPLPSGVSGITQASLIRPDGGVTTYNYIQSTSYYSSAGSWSGFVGSETRPDGSVLGKSWAFNPPVGIPGIEGSRANQFVSWEYETAVGYTGGTSLVKTRQYTVDQNGNSLAVEDRDWTAWTGSAPTSAAVGTLVRKTINTPKYPAPALGSSTLNANLYTETSAPAAWSLVDKTTVEDGGQTLVSETQFEYDAVGNLHYEKVRDKRSTGLDTLRTTTYTRDTRGRILTVRDPDGVGADYLYNACSEFALSQVSRTGIGATALAYDCVPISGQPGVYGIPVMTQKTNPNSRVDQFAYDTVGRLTQATFGNSKRTRYVYNDEAMWVMTRDDRVSFNDGAATVVEYDDPLGRVRKTRTLETAGMSDTSAADEAGAAIVVDTKYETSSTRVAVMVSNPYNSSSTSDERGWTVTLKDTSGRTCAIEHYAGASIPTPGTCSAAGSHGGRTTLAFGTVSTAPLGTAVKETVTGTPNQVTERITDGIGRLARVVESSGTLNYSTSYSHDAAARLLGVTQGTKTRSFTYSTAGWLLTSTNPESGLITYDYTPGGRLLKKVDARPLTVCMGVLSGSTCTGDFDAAGRPLKKSYSTGSTQVSYAYSGERLTQVANGTATIGYSHDELDRITSRSQAVVGGSTYTASATYRPGGVATETYPGGRVLTYGVDAIGRTTSVRAGASDYYVSATTYAAHGGARSMTFGNSQTETQTWNHRLQSTGISRGSAFSLTYAYCASGASCATNNGNLVSQTIGHAAGAVQNYTFDTLGRLATAAEGSTWSRSFGADQWGNSWVTANSGVTLASFTPVGTDLGSSNFDANNRLQIQGSNYDAAGNQTVIGGYSFAYDGENRLAQSTLGGASASYSYDGEGRRVKKVNGSRTVVYVYGVDGNLIQEYDTATPAETGRQYLAQDMLGSTRVVFNSAGTAVRCMDYLPFGEQIPQGVGAGRSGACWAASEEPRQKFTGKERAGADGSYLDFFGARYFSASQGRFTTPDWAEKPEAVPYASFEDPQSLNLYGYVRNNPINNRDLDGHVCWPWGRCAQVPQPPPRPPAPAAPTNPVFPTVDKAAVAAARMNQQKQKETGAEHASSVFTVGTAYTYTDAVTQGRPDTVDPHNTTKYYSPITVSLDKPPIPDGSQLVAETHSHPNNRGWSGRDIQRAHDLTIPAFHHPLFQGMYVGQPNGVVIKWNPFLGRSIAFPKGWGQ